MPEGLAGDLIREFTDVLGLDAVDAHRNAFTALAVRNVWSRARIARWLGVSRARVGQKVEKLEYYAATTKGIPVLKKVMREAEAAAAKVEAQKAAGTYEREQEVAVEWNQGQWDDIDFARRIIEMLV